MRVHFFKLCFLGVSNIFIFLSSFTVQAQSFTGPISQSLGHTGVAAYDSAENTLINPATLVLAPGFEWASYYEGGTPQSSVRQSVWGLTLVDNGQQIAFPGTITYLKNRYRKEGAHTVNSEYWGAGVAGYFFKTMALGLHIHRLDQKVEGGESYETWNADLGYLVHGATSALGVSLLHILDNPTTVPEALRSQPQLKVGGQYIWGRQFLYRVDMTYQLKQNPKNDLVYGVGIGHIFNSFLVGRLGYFWNTPQKEQLASVGLGFNGPKLKLDYSYQRGVKGHKEELHGVDIRVGF